MSSTNNPRNYYQKGYPQNNHQYAPPHQHYYQQPTNNQDISKPSYQPISQPPMLHSFNPSNQQKKMPHGWQFMPNHQQGQLIQQANRNQSRGEQTNNPRHYQMRQVQNPGQDYLEQSVPYQQGLGDNGNQKYHYQQGQQQQQQGWSNKFFEIFERFQWAYERFEQLRQMYSFLHNKLQTVDSQQDWNQFKSYNDQLYEKFQQTQYQMNTVMSENQRLMQAKFGEDQNVNWQERYKELLGNYKKFQEQANQLIRQSNPNQNAHQRAKDLQQFNQLKDEYIKIYNDMQSAQQHIEELNHENTKYAQILETLQNNIQQLNQNNAILQRQLASKPSISRQDYDQFNNIIDQKDCEILKLKKYLALKDNETQTRIQQQIRQKNSQINILKSMIEKIQGQLNSSFTEDFNKIISIKSEQIDHYRKLLRSSEEQYEMKLRQRQQQIAKDYQEKLISLSTQLQQLQQRSSENNPLSDVKLASYQKKLVYYEQQIENLNGILRKKNQEINRLRDSTFQLQNMRLLKNQKIKVQEINEQLQKNLQNKVRQVEQLKLQISDLQIKLKEVSQKKNQAFTKGYLDQIRDLKNIITSKDNAISKLRQYQQSKERTINQLQHENQLTRQKLIANEKKLQIEKEQFRTDLRIKQSRNLDLQRKIRSIQLDFGQSAKANLMSEISILRSQNQSKQQMIVKLQNQQIELKGSITHLQRQKKDIDHEVRTLRTQHKQQLSIKKDLNKKIESLAIDVSSKNKIIQTLQNHQQKLKSQIEKFQKQIIQLENILKSKNLIINQLEDKFQQINGQYSEVIKQRDACKKQFKRQNDAHESAIKQLQYKLKESQDLIKSGKLWSHLELKNNQNQQIIKKLKADNEILRNEVAKSLDATKRSTFEQLCSSQTNPDFQQQNFLEKRLRDFNLKLDEMMGRKVPIDQNSRICKENQFSNIENSQINSLKDRIVQLQEYCNTLQERIVQSDDIFFKSRTINQINIFNEQEKIYKQQLNFHKKRAEQFEERINSLLKINRDLKSKLQVLLKTNPDNTSSSSFYKTQLEIVEKNVQNLNQKVRKLSEQNSLLKKQSSQTNFDILTQYQSKITQFQDTIQGLQRKIRQFQIQKVTSENEKVNLKHTISRLESNVQILKSNMSQKISMYQGILQQTRNKYITYNQDLKDMGNSSRVISTSRLDIK